MPMYEFVCRNCAGEFTELCPINWQGKVKCPVCGEADITKTISQIGGSGRSGGGCGSCSSQKCSSCH